MDYKGFFDKTGESPKYAAALAAMAYDIAYAGVAHKFLNKLEVIRTTSNTVTVDTGGVFSRGRWFAQDEAVILNVDAAPAGYLRKDYAVVEFDVDTKTATVKISKGTEVQSNPVVNDLLDGANKWEEPLGIVNIEGGAIKTEGGIEDKRIMGNQRTSPDFEDPISSPKVTTDISMVNSGGKSCFASENTYLQHDGSDLNYQKEGCETVQVALVICGTGDPPDTGTYPANTIYIKYIEPT